MKIMINSDVSDWAIGTLTKSIIKHNPRFNWVSIDVHPRGLANSFIYLHDALKDGVDVWHAQYWNSALNMLDAIPELKHIPSVLTHQNHNSLEKKDWNMFNGLVHPTHWGCEKLRKKHKNVFHIPHGIDLDRYTWIDEPCEEDNVGYIGRVMPHKHLKEICIAAKNLNYMVLGSGYVDKIDYWNSIGEVYYGKDAIETMTDDEGIKIEKFKEFKAPEKYLKFLGGSGRVSMAPANMKDDLYRKMKVFVMYSTGEYESGTLPLFEAMARGVPVMATSQGSARDLIEHGKNGIIFNEDNFEEELKKLMEDKELRMKLRKNAWQTVKNYSDQRLARRYAKVYYDIGFNGQPVVSVIIPTFERAEHLADTIMSVEMQDYVAKEIIVIDDGSDDNGETKMLCNKLKTKIDTPLLYLNTNDTKHYGLAKARNMGVVESLGETLLFLDDRLVLEEGALEEVANVKDGEWNFGGKRTKTGLSTKRTFIENFSWIKKTDFVKGGMFNERMGYYGGMSQILREQYKEKVEFIYNDKAVAKEAVRAKRGRKSDIWKAKDIINKLYD